MSTPPYGPTRELTMPGMLNARNLAALVLAAVLCACVLLLTVEQLTFFVSDDAYYYLQVAHNITRGAGSSFDGFDPTNGYHPLWMLCLLPVYWLCGSSPEFALRVTLLTQSLMVTATVWLAWDLYRRYRATAVGIIVAIGLLGILCSPLQIMFNGLETDLVILLVVVIAHADAQRSFLGQDQPAARQVLFGLLLGLVVLARLDEAFLVIGIALWSLITQWPGTFVARLRLALRSYWLTIVVFTAVVSAYLVWNLLEFGHFTPISGTLKATFPQPVFRWELLVQYAPWVGVTLLAGIALVPMLRRPAAALPRPHVHLLTGLWIGCLAQIGWAVFFTRWGTFQWHFAAHIPTACLILSLYVSRSTRSTAVVAATAVVTASAVLWFNVYTYQDKGDYHEAAYSAATWARSNTAPGTVFALRDAGVFGYFSGRPTINLDGLINSYDYQNYVRAGRVMDFLRERNLRFVADAYSPCAYTERHVWVRSYLPPRPPETVAYGLTVTRDTEAYRSAARIFTRSLPHPICFIVWPFEAVSLEVRDPARPLRH